MGGVSSPKLVGDNRASRTALFDDIEEARQTIIKLAGEGDCYSNVSASERRRRDNMVEMTRNIVMEKLQLGGPSIRTLELEELKQKTNSVELHLTDVIILLVTLASEGFVYLQGDSVKKRMKLKS